MKISDIQDKSEITERITLIVGGEEQWIDVTSVNSHQFAAGQSWFKRTCAEHALAGKTLVDVQEVDGQKVTVQSDEYRSMYAILIAHLIVGWSFDNELSLADATALIKLRPNLIDEIDRVSSRMGAAEDSAKKPQSSSQKGK